MTSLWKIKVKLKQFEIYLLVIGVLVLFIRRYFNNFKNLLTRVYNIFDTDRVFIFRDFEGTKELL